MAISDNQPVNASASNTAWMSRTTDTDTVGKVNLNNADSAFVIDLQQIINNLLTQTYAEETLSAAATITSDTDQRYQVRRVKSDGGNVSVSTTPFGTSGLWTDGTIIELVGTDAADFITIEFNDAPYGAIVNGDIDMDLYRVLVLRWDSVLVRWIEIGRNK